MTKSAIYPGSFDPITYGHLDLVQRATHVFDHVIVAVAENTPKKTLFDVEQRVSMAKEAVKEFPRVSVESFKGLIIHYAKTKNIHVLIRGVRMVSDFEYELQMALTNRRLDDTIETVFLMPSESHSFTSSTLIKEGMVLGADLSSFIPDHVAQMLKRKLGI